MSTQVAICNPAIRNRQAFADHGYAVAAVDGAKDGVLFDYTDLQEIVRYMQSQDKVPTWIMGGSVATPNAVNLVARLPLSNGLGAVFYSPEDVDAAQVAMITRPALVVFHVLDPRSRGPSLFAALTSAPYKLQVALTGGNNAGCAGYHTLNALNGPFVDTVNSFIDQYNATLAYSPLTTSVKAVEFYNVTLDHFFLTHVANEIALLDAGVAIKGWTRTGLSFNVLPSAQPGSSAVCRYYIPPGKGDSHFYGRGTAECDATGVANPTFVNEEPHFFYAALPVLGTCSADTVPVYRVFSNRADANHRYMVSRTVRDEMTGRGWLAEGDGPDLVVMCAPA